MVKPAPFGMSGFPAGGVFQLSERVEPNGGWVHGGPTRPMIVELESQFAAEHRFLPRAGGGPVRNPFPSGLAGVVPQTARPAKSPTRPTDSSLEGHSQT